MNYRRPLTVITITVLFSLYSLRLDAGVIFEFTYFDSPGTGFNAGALGDALGTRCR